MLLPPQSALSAPLLGNAPVRAGRWMDIIPGDHRQRPLALYIPKQSRIISRNAKLRCPRWQHPQLSCCSLPFPIPQAGSAFQFSRDS